MFFAGILLKCPWLFTGRILTFDSIIIICDILLNFHIWAYLQIPSFYERVFQLQSPWKKFIRGTGHKNMADFEIPDSEVQFLRQQRADQLYI